MDNQKVHTMQTRLLASLAGGLLGVVVASPLGASLGLSGGPALAGCAVLGVGVGYVGSILFDVFTSSPGDPTEPSAPQTPPRPRR
jgi:hypothetical protein